MKKKIMSLFLYSALLFSLLNLSLTQSLSSPADVKNSASSENISSDCFRLQESLMSYKKIAYHGGWPAVSNGDFLEKGDRGERIIELKRRLDITGDLSVQISGIEDVFDEDLYNAVIRFQRRHGIAEDGVVGPETISRLNIPVENKIRQMEINIQRLRHMTKCKDKRHITVNIAAFDLQVIENEDTVMNMKVIVGKPYWHSPLFSAKITHMVFNPSWYVPNSIAVKEILPMIKKEPDYLVTEGIKVFEKEKGYKDEIDASAINWADVSADKFKYSFVQDPGILNPLGKIKFIFPNKYNVYLHDTPTRVLFEKNSRAFSHGCIRIEKPIELAEYLLRDDPAWTREKILEMIEGGEEVSVQIPSPVNVHILYLTAWVDKDNILQFRQDVYERDR